MKLLTAPATATDGHQKGKIMKTKEYRFDQYDSVYRYSVAINAYIFVGKLNGKTRKQFIADHQSQGN